MGKDRPHMAIPKTYAWKPLAIKETIDLYGYTLWLDAGNTVTGQLTRPLNYLYDDNFFFVQGQDVDMTLKTYKKMYEYFNVDKENFIKKPSFAGAVMGMTNNTFVYNNILLPWYYCAMNVECIAPIGSSIKSHRYDQSALSIILYKNILAGLMTVTPHTELLAANAEQLNKCERESYMVFWTSRKQNKCYSKYAVCK